MQLRLSHLLISVLATQNRNFDFFDVRLIYFAIITALMIGCIVSCDT